MTDDADKPDTDIPALAGCGERAVALVHELCELVSTEAGRRLDNDSTGPQLEEWVRDVIADVEWEIVHEIIAQHTPGANWFFRAIPEAEFLASCEADNEGRP